MKKEVLRGFAILGALVNTGCVVTPVRTVPAPVVYTEPTATVVVRECPAVVETVVVTPAPVVAPVPPPPRPHPAWHYPPMHPRIPHPLKPMPAPPHHPRPMPHGGPHHPPVHRGR